jgi:pyrimidine oxygenase
MRIGMFMPTMNKNWVFSTTSPESMPEWFLAQQAAMKAEHYGFDFLLSAVKYRGFDGATSPWNNSLDAIAVMAGLAASTKRIKLFGSIATLLTPPVVAAKQAATIADMSGGRFGLNIVTGSFPSEMKQMSLWRLEHDTRYDDAAEYVTCLRRLWTEDRVTFRGTYYTLEDCESNPKPLQKPSPPVLCAGISDKGLQFTAEYGDIAFIGTGNTALAKQISPRAKQIAAAAGRSIRTMACVMPIGANTQGEAEARYRYYLEGQDRGGVQKIMDEFGIRGGSSPKEMFDQFTFFGAPLIGDANRVADMLVDLQQGGLDGVVLMLPDYIEDQVWIAQQVMPRVRQRMEAAVRGPAIA